MSISNCQLLNKKSALLERDFLFTDFLQSCGTGISLLVRLSADCVFRTHGSESCLPAGRNLLHGRNLKLSSRPLFLLIEVAGLESNKIYFVNFLNTSRFLGIPTRRNSCSPDPLLVRPQPRTDTKNYPAGVVFSISCRTWIRTKITASRELCPTIRRSGKYF